MLLDSHALLWLMIDDDRLGPASRERLADAHTVLFSAASLWELHVKEQTGKLIIPRNLAAQAHAAGLQELPVTSAHVDALRQVTLPHRDPFDQLLVAQAVSEGIDLLTADRVLLAAAPLRTLDARR